MSEILDRLEGRLYDAGWAVRDRSETPDGERVNAVRWLLGSRRPPLGVEVELGLRVYSRPNCNHYWYYFEEDVLTGATVRYPPADETAQSEAEANFAGEEITRGNYRQLVRVLEWFRDPISGDFWHTAPQAGDWEPPVGWAAQAGSRRVGLEARWAGCRDAGEMLRYLPGKPSPRKLRLIACACCRLLSLPMLHEYNVAAVAAVERHAEHGGPRRELKKSCKRSDLPWLAQDDPFAMALQAVLLATRERAGQARAADVVREIVGDPFRPVSLRREWVRNLGGVVSHLAETIAAERRYDEMPILADALEDAGCVIPSVLDHCRGPGPHLPGCWVLDLLRGRD